MFKLIQNLLSSTSNRKTSSAISKSNTSIWSEQIAQADTLWEQGKLSEALAIYGLAIEQNPNLPEIKQRLAERLKQQGDLAIAYEKLATGLKNQGNIEQAANYYRQAINLKAITGNSKDQLLRSSVVPTKKSPIPIASLKEAAFSFQPLTNTAIVVASPQFPLPGVEAAFSSSPQFPQRLKAVDPKQARDIDWETAQVYFQKALEHLEKQEWSQSALACKQATQIMPEMAEAYKIWGNALQRMGKTGEAMSCYAKAVEVKPNLAEVYAGIADIYSQQEKWEQAVKHYQKAIIIKPSAKIYRKLAAVWDRLGESEKVEFNLYQAKELESSQNTSAETVNATKVNHLGSANNLKDSVANYCRLAQELEQQNQWRQAAQYYRLALDLSMSQLSLPPRKSSQQLTNGVNQAKVQQPRQVNNFAPQTESASENQLDKAIKRYHKQSKLQPNSPRIYTDLGNLYAKKGKLQQAIACYRQAIKFNRKYPKAHLSLGRAMLKMGRQREFIKEMQLALALQPTIGTAMDRFYLGNALVEQNQQQQAIGFYYKAIVLNPKFLSSYHRLSDILDQQGKHQEAIEFLLQGIEHNPQSPESYYLLAQQWEKLQNWDNAVKTYSRVLQLEPQFPEALQKLNHALAEKLKMKRQAKT
jgi:tetratricopeptide (TPR) repeat protein